VKPASHGRDRLPNARSVRPIERNDDPTETTSAAPEFSSLGHVYLINDQIAAGTGVIQ
jgi:hypothetical protein